MPLFCIENFNKKYFLVIILLLTFIFNSVIASKQTTKSIILYYIHIGELWIRAIHAINLLRIKYVTILIHGKSFILEHELIKWLID